MDETKELIAAAEAMARLSGERDVFGQALEAHRKGDPKGFAAALEHAGVSDRRHLVCGWFCSKECVLRCVRLAGAPTRAEVIPDVAEFADVTARLGADEAMLRKLVEVVENGDPRSYKALLAQVDMSRFAHLICFWVCATRCRLRCRVVAGEQSDPPDLVKELATTSVAVRRLAADPRAFKTAIAAAQANDCERLQKVIVGVGLSRDCYRICWWLCSWRAVMVCFTLCRPFLAEQLEGSDDEIFQFAQVTGELASQPEMLDKLADAVQRVDEQAFTGLVKELGLQKFCVQLCQWIHFWRCRRLCLCVCPPLVARIDEPTADSCAQSTAVASCMSATGPLVGIQIMGTASGAGFDHYTLRYSWGANPAVTAAVVYPDCSRPPAAMSSSVPVTSGILGWLDVTMLPVGITAFTVYLDVFDTAAGSVSATTTFEIRTKAVEITAVATVEALNAFDPFNPGTVIRLIKDTNDPSVLVPETAVGGSITVDGSAYVVGCDRILSQFVLARFDAPPASPPPTPADATAAGGTNLITPVPYEDVPGHPWQSGCFPVSTPNTIMNGNLVAVWDQINCSFLGTAYKVPKVKGRTWATAPLNGRFVVLLEVRDRLLPAGGFPGDVAGVERVAVWIDNQDPTATINSIGGIAGCGDVLLSKYTTNDADIRGVAWDPPIVPSAPQQAPNDNFGSYSLAYKKNGEVSTFAIPASTPNSRVPNAWPALPPSPDGLLAQWDIVAALDYTGPAPTPPGKLARGSRCAFVITLNVIDTTHVGDSGNHHHTPFDYAITIINDL